MRVEEARPARPSGFSDWDEVDDLIDVHQPGTLVAHHRVPGDLSLQPAHALLGAGQLDPTRRALRPMSTPLWAATLGVHLDRVAL
jgi:hypothetical protein